jgi:cationic peptide transport system ATP-binding protein
MIFQDPSTSLNPRQRISQILDFPLRLNTELEPEERRKRIIETLRMVGLLPDHESYTRICWPRDRNSVWVWRAR